MRIKGITIRGMSVEEIQKSSPKVTSAVLHMLVGEGSFGISLDPHFYLEFCCGIAHTDHNRRAVVVDFRIKDIMSLTEEDVTNGEKLEALIMETVEKTLQDKGIFASVIVNLAL